MELWGQETEGEMGGPPKPQPPRPSHLSFVRLRHFL